MTTENKASGTQDLEATLVGVTQWAKSTGTEIMRAAVALARLRREITGQETSVLRRIINGATD